MKGFYNQEEIARFIDLVCQHPLLYDPSAKQSDIQSTKAVWSSITAEMCIPHMFASDWKNKWKCLRDTYVKKKREIRLADTQEKVDKATQWRFYQNMTFLDPFVDKISIKPVPRSNGIDYQHYTIIKKEYYADKESGEEGEEYSTISLGDQQSTEETTTPTRSLRKRKRRAPEDYEAAESSVLNQQSHSGEDDDSWNGESSGNSKSFFESCSYRMDKLPERVQSYLQLQISQLFFNAENPDVPSVPIMPLPPAQTPS